LEDDFWGILRIETMANSMKVALDNRTAGSTMKVSPPILVRIEWADSQGRVTASWLAARLSFGTGLVTIGRRSCENSFTLISCCPHSSIVEPETAMSAGSG
jgi:hypothetical protein